MEGLEEKYQMWGVMKMKLNKGHLRGSVEALNNINFLKYMHIWGWSKWNHQIIGKTEPQLVISYHQKKSPVLEGSGYI